MKKKSFTLKLLGTSLFAVSTITVVTTLASCSALGVSQETNNNHTPTVIPADVKKVYDEYTKQYNAQINNSKYYLLTKEKSISWMKIINDALIQVNSLLNSTGLDVDSSIWAKSFKYDLQIKQKLLQSGYYLLIPNAYDQLSLTQYSKTLARNLSGTSLISTNTTEQQAIENMDNLWHYIDDVQSILDEAASVYNITYSGIQAKMGIAYIIKTVWSNELSQWAQTNVVPKTVTTYDFIKQKFNNSATIVTKVDELNKKLGLFLKFLTQDYYRNINYGRSDVAGSIFTVERDENPAHADVEDPVTYTITIDQRPRTVYFNGLGLNEKDLNTNDIGIGFMRNKDGRKIYEALLMKHSTTNKTAKEIYNLGQTQVGEIKNAMQKTANKIADEIVGKNKPWTATEKYDTDSSGTKFGSTPETFSLRPAGDNQQVNLDVFFKWMNSDRWFNGRDMLDTQYATVDPINKTPIINGTNIDSKTPYLVDLNYVSNNNAIHSVDIGTIIGSPNYTGENANGQYDGTVVYGDAGNLYYKYITHQYSPAYDISGDSLGNGYNASAPSITQTPNSISTEAAYIGAASSVKQYLMFKEASAPHYTGAFKPTSFDYTLRSGTGGAAYASSGEGGTSWVDKGYGGFYLDVNPYFGLQKWSMTTLATHEGITGHVFQYNYAKEHPVSSDAISFNYTSYAEGWGLFSEWLAVQMGMYGEPANTNGILKEEDILKLPTFGLNSKNINVTQFKNKTEFANGAYWINRDGLNGNSQALFDATQYFGFLNERQLRAMRMTIDTGIHSGDGNYTPGSGWSLNQAREYMNSNSALGIDDVKRESKRYLNYVGQAVSYYNGLITMENIWKTANNKYIQNHPIKTGDSSEWFLDFKNPQSTNKNTNGLLDLILRNDDIPLSVLNEYCINYINTDSVFQKA